MTRAPIVRGLAAVALIAMFGGACGGSTPAGSDGTGASGDVASSVVEITGAETATISAPGSCGEDLGDTSSWNAMFQTDELDWMLDITLEGTMEPGQYPVGDHEAGKATLMLYAGGGGASYDGVPGNGVVRVEDGSDHGSIDATFTNAADGTTVTVVGAWTCES